MKKRVIACLLAGLMTVSLAACGGGGVSSNSSSSKGNDDSKKSEADSEVGVEQTATPQAPPEDAPVGGQYASATGIVRLAKRKLANETRKTLLEKDMLSAKSIFDAVKEGDAVAMEVAEEFGRYLGYALANLAVISDPAVIVIGGGVSKAGEILISYVEKYFKERAFFANTHVIFSLAKLGNDAGICGAAKLVLN